jgi:protein O-GlcNAc transferase
MENPHQDPFKTATILHRAGDLALAEQFYLQALNEQPGDYDASFGYATMLSAADRKEEAKTIFNGILAVLPDDVDTLINLGNVYQQDGQFAEAENCYLRAAGKEPYLPQIQANLGSLYQRQGLYEKAIQHHRNAIELDPFETITLNNLGIAQLHLGDSDNAKESFQNALVIDPDQPQTHKHLGNLLMAEGNFTGALKSLDRAVELAPTWAEAIADRGLARQRNGDFAGALADFEQALALMPDLGGAWLALAALYLETKQHEKARVALDKAASLSPQNGLVSAHQGNLAHELGDIDTALEHFAKACRENPDSGIFHLSYGTALVEAKRPEEALPVLQKANELDPNSCEILNNLGTACNALGRYEEAIAYFAEAADIDSDMAAMAACNMGNVRRELGELEAALASFELALAKDPTLTAAHNGSGLVYQLMNRFDDAIAAYERALDINPDYVEALNNMAVAYLESGHLSKAVESLNRLLDRNPDMPHAMFNLGTLLQTLDRWDEAIIVLTRLLQIAPENNKTYPYLAHALMQQCNWSNLNAIIDRIRQNIVDELAANKPLSITAFALQSLPGEFSMDLRRRVAERLAQEVETSVREMRQEANFRHERRRRHKRLRIGYISPDFRFHSVAVAFRGILFSHDKSRFKIYGYALPGGGRPDAMTAELAQQFDVFRSFEGVAYPDGARLIYEDEIDILVDLAGYTRGSHPHFLAMRAAPVQAHYLGYSTTLGARYMDYVITDRHQFHDDETHYLTEEPVFLPHTFMSTQRAPVAVHRPDRSDCGLPQDAVVLMNFNGHYKFDPEMFSIWMRLMRRHPETVLWLGWGTDGSRANLRKEALTRGVDPDRLIFAERATHPEHLARLPLGDIALDNQFHGGGVTTVDCLWMGIPVVTLADTTPQSRNGATLLAAIGVDELVTHSLADYEKKIADLITDREKRQAVGAQIRNNRDSEPLFDSEMLTRNLENAYEMMWDNFEQGEKPQPIWVPRACRG